MGKIYVVTSGKGGVGKSTVATFLGIALSKMGRRVLLIDMDAGLRSLDLMLNVSDKTVFDINDIINENCDLNEAVLPASKCPGLFLLPAPLTVDAINNKQDMQKLCSIFSEGFDYVFIDSPAGIGKGFEIAVCAADRAFVVATPDPVSVRDAAYVANLLREQGLSEIRLVINKLNSKYMQKGIFNNIDEMIDATSLQLISVIPNDVELVKASALGELLKDSYANDAFVRFAKRLEGKKVSLPDFRKFS